MQSYGSWKNILIEKNTKNFLDKKIASMEGLGKAGLATKALKGISAVLSTGTGLVIFLF